MPNRRNGGDLWRKAANDARVMAETFHGSAARLAMLEIARHYESIARRLHAQRAALTVVGNDEDQRAAG
jgi:hypothetical protein